MVAPATAAASDLRIRAHAELEGTLAFLASAKNAPVRASDMQALAASLVSRADEPRLRQLTARDNAIGTALFLSLDESLDWMAARNIVLLLAQQAGLPLPATLLQSLVTRLLAEIKVRSKVGRLLRWPDGAEFDEAAAAFLEIAGTSQGASLEAALSDFAARLKLDWIEPVRRSEDSHG